TWSAIESSIRSESGSTPNIAAGRGTLSTKRAYYRSGQAHADVSVVVSPADLLLAGRPDVPGALSHRMAVVVAVQNSGNCGGRGTGTLAGNYLPAGAGFARSSARLVAVQKQERTRRPALHSSR